MSSPSFRSAVFAALPGRVDTITEATGMDRTTVKKWLKDLYKNGESHISGWKQVFNGRYVARYSPGPGKDVPCSFLAPSGVDGLAGYERPPAGAKIVLDALPGGLESLRLTIKLSDRAIRNALVKLHKNRKIRIIRWERHSINAVPMPIYAKGGGVDAICNIRSLTKKELRARAKLKQERIAKEIESNEKKLILNDSPIIQSEIKAQIRGWATPEVRRRAINQADAASKIGDPLVLALFSGRKVQATSVGRECAMA